MRALMGYRPAMWEPGAASAGIWQKPVAVALLPSSGRRKGLGSHVGVLERTHVAAPLSGHRCARAAPAALHLPA